MSFKVYDGVKIEGVTTIAEAMDFIKSFKGPILENIQADKAKTIKSVAALLYDQYHFGGIDAFDDEDPNRIPLLTAMHRLREVNAKDNGSTEYNIGIAEYDGHIVAVPLLGDKASYKLFMDDPRVTPWGYWDNVDPDENASEEEWQLRETVWSAVYEGPGVHSECLLMLRLCDANHVIPEDKFMDEPPTVEQREKSLAHTMGMDAAYVESHSDDPNTPPQFGKMVQRSQELAKEILPTITGKLNADLTMKDLEHTVPKREKKVQHSKKDKIPKHE